MLYHALGIAAYLLVIGAYGLITSRNMIKALICLELMLNAVNLNLVGFASCFQTDLLLQGHVFVLFILAIAAAEAAIGLAIVLNLYRNRKSVSLDQFNLLKW